MKNFLNIILTVIIFIGALFAVYKIWPVLCDAASIANHIVKGFKGFYQVIKFFLLLMAEVKILQISSRLIELQNVFGNERKMERWKKRMRSLMKYSAFFISGVMIMIAVLFFAPMLVSGFFHDPDNFLKFLMFIPGILLAILSFVLLLTGFAFIATSIEDAPDS